MGEMTRLRHGVGPDDDDPRHHRHRIGVDVLAATVVEGRERVFLLDQFLHSASRIKDTAQKITQETRDSTAAFAPLSKTSRGEQYADPMPSQDLVHNDIDQIAFAMDDILGFGLRHTRLPGSNVYSDTHVSSGSGRREKTAFSDCRIPLGDYGKPGKQETPLVSDANAIPLATRNHHVSPQSSVIRSITTMSTDKKMQSTSALGFNFSTNQFTSCKDNRRLVSAAGSRSTAERQAVELTARDAKSPSSQVSSTLGRPISIRRAKKFVSIESIAMLVTICDALPYESKVLLSQTCRTLRHQLRSSFATSLESTPNDQFVEHQTELAQSMPLHIVCACCNRLHRALVGDIPAYGLPLSAAKHFCNHKNRHEYEQNGADLGYGYHLQYHHVQLALKLRRLGLLRTYADTILQPYRVRSLGYITGIAMEVVVQPILTLHEQRPSFLIFRKMEFTQNLAENPQPLEADTIQYLFVCPHASLAENEAEDTRCAVLYDAVDDANFGLKTHHDFSCRRCPTDICIDTEPGHLCVQVWHDFGTEGLAPNNGRWNVHVSSPNNNEFLGPSIRHINGSVRTRYEDAMRMQDYTAARSPVLEGDVHNLAPSALHQAGRVNVENRAQGKYRMERFGGMYSRENHGGF